MSQPGETLDLLSATEQKALGLTGDLARLLDLIVAAGETRPADLTELHAHIHAIQHAIMSQAAARAYPLLYRPLGYGWRYA